MYNKIGTYQEMFYNIKFSAKVSLTSSYAWCYNIVTAIDHMWKASKDSFNTLANTVPGKYPLLLVVKTLITYM